MGSWHADDAAEAVPERPEPKQLRLLSAHHIFLAGVSLADTGQDAWRECLGHGRHHRPTGQRLEIGWRIEVGCLRPTLLSARHTANQDINLWSLQRKIAFQEGAEHARIGIG